MSVSITKGNFAVSNASGSSAPSAGDSSWVQFKAASIKQSNESLASEDSGRSDNGYMYIRWVRSKVRKWEISIPPCTAEEAYTLFNKVQGKQYWIYIWDVSINDYSRIKVYTSSTATDCYSGVLNSGNGLYQGISFSAIEV